MMLIQHGQNHRHYVHSHFLCNTLLVMFLNQFNQFSELSSTHCPPPSVYSVNGSANGRIYSVTQSFESTFEVDEETTLGETRGVDDKSNIGDTGVHFDRVTPERTTVPEVGRRRRWRRRRRRPVPERRQRGGSRHGRYLDVVLAAAGPLDVQLKVEYGEANRLSWLDTDAPPALGVHVILVGIVWTGQVASAVEFDGRRFTEVGRQRRTSTVDRRNYISIYVESKYLTMLIS